MALASHARLTLGAVAMIGLAAAGCKTSGGPADDSLKSVDIERQPCEMATSPFASELEARTGFVNHTAWPVVVYRQTPTAARELVRTLAAREGASLVGKVGEYYELAYADQGTCVGRYAVTGTATTTVGFIGSWLPKRGCGFAGRSPVSGAEPTSISFRNATNAPIKIHWIKNDGSLTQLAEIAQPGASTRLTTSDGHVFQANDANGNCINRWVAQDNLWAEVN